MGRRISKLCHANGRNGADPSLQTNSGKIFAGIYAMYCGLVLLIAVGIFAAPIVHRFLHHFHLESERKDQ